MLITNFLSICLQPFLSKHLCVSHCSLFNQHLSYNWLIRKFLPIPKVLIILMPFHNFVVSAFHHALCRLVSYFCLFLHIFLTAVLPSTNGNTVIYFCFSITLCVSVCVFVSLHLSLCLCVCFSMCLCVCVSLCKNSAPRTTPDVCWLLRWLLAASVNNWLDYTSLE